MKSQAMWLSAAVLLGGAVICGVARADADKKATTIWVKMHCGGCAKKITAKLYKVPNVAQVKADPKADIVVVTPKGSKLPSPRAQWEAVENAGFKPTKLQGPYGTFTSKPRS